MKSAEVQLPEPLYRQVEGLAKQLHLSVPEVLCQAAEQMVQRQTQRQIKQNRDWCFPDARGLGAFLAPAKDWRLLANEGLAE
jgi:hypothetical protein